MNVRERIDSPTEMSAMMDEGVRMKVPKRTIMYCLWDCGGNIVTGVSWAPRLEMLDDQGLIGHFGASLWSWCRTWEVRFLLRDPGDWACWILWKC